MEKPTYEQLLVTIQIVEKEYRDLYFTFKDNNFNKAANEAIETADYLAKVVKAGRQE